MFIENAAQMGANYYPRTTELFALNGVSSGGFAQQLHALDGASGKTWEDFLPRDWFDSSVYRNILDQINTIEVTRRNLWYGFLGTFVGWPRGVSTTPPRPRDYCTHVNWFQVGTDQAFTGWAINEKGMPKSKLAGSQLLIKTFWPGVNWNPKNTYLQNYPQVCKILQRAGYKPHPGGYAKYQCVMSPCISYKGQREGQDAVWRHNALIAKGNGYTADDLVDLVRSLDWEMNRVHLPLPFNLRQWVTEFRKHSIGGGSMSFYQYGLALKQLVNWIKIMREKIRRAIDASGYAKIVAEKSLRKEDARIIREREAEQKAREAARLKAIEQERLEAARIIEAERKKLIEQAKAEAAAIAAEAKIKAQQQPVTVPREIEDVARTMVTTPVDTQLAPPPTPPKPAPIPKEVIVPRETIPQETTPITQEIIEVSRETLPQMVKTYAPVPDFPETREKPETRAPQQPQTITSNVPLVIAGAGLLYLLSSRT